MKDGDREAAVKVSCEIPALLLFFSRHGRRWRRRCRSCGCRRRRLRRRIAAHAVLEFAHALPQTLHHFRNLLPAEKDKYHSGDNQEMHWAVKHRNLPFAPGRTAPGTPNLPHPAHAAYRSTSRPGRRAPQTLHLRLQYNTLVPSPPRHVLAVQMLEQRNRILPADSRKLFERRDRQAIAFFLAVLRQQFAQLR